MDEISPETILNEVTNFYLNSSDFNGIPTNTLAENLGVDWQVLLVPLIELIRSDLVGVIYADASQNPHINRIGFEKTTTQIDKLGDDNPPHACVYPHPNHLKTVIDESLFEGQPYKLCQAVGEPQLAYRSFDLSVLEFYRNDPRYNYKNNDVSGKICHRSDDLQRSDKIFMQTFGFSYDENLNRAVAVFLRYLSDLSSEHQLIWQAKELNGNYKLHPDYYRSAIIGDFGEKVPICSAFLKELYIINQMAEAMERPPLFHNDFGKYGENKPQRFGFLVRTTLEEFNSFILLLDKMLSDNINKAFFQNEVSYTREIHRKDGKIEVQHKGTLIILDEWVRKYFRPDSWEFWDKSIKTLRDVRKMRQNPAHKINENIFDQRYFKEQRELIMEAYSAIKSIRLMLENHPAVQAANIDVPTWLREGHIWTR